MRAHCENTHTHTHIRGIRSFDRRLLGVFIAILKKNKLFYLLFLPKFRFFFSSPPCNVRYAHVFRVRGDHRRCLLSPVRLVDPCAPVRTTATGSNRLGRPRGRHRSVPGFAGRQPVGRPGKTAVVLRPNQVVEFFESEYSVKINTKWSTSSERVLYVLGIIVNCLVSNAR